MVTELTHGNRVQFHAPRASASCDKFPSPAPPNRTKTLPNPVCPFAPVRDRSPTVAAVAIRPPPLPPHPATSTPSFGHLRPPHPATSAAAASSHLALASGCSAPSRHSCSVPSPERDPKPRRLGFARRRRRIRRPPPPHPLLRQQFHGLHIQT